MKLKVITEFATGFIIILALTVMIIFSFGFGFSEGYKMGQDSKIENWREAYEAFSDPQEFCLLWTDDSGMHGFQYKNKTYPLMTTGALKEIVRSKIWVD